MIRRTNSFPREQSKSFTRAVNWSYSTARGHAWSLCWKGSMGTFLSDALSRSGSWSNGWSTAWEGLHWQ